MWMNEWDIAEALDRFDTPDTPNLHKGAQVVDALREWTNRNSDGWAYWHTPSRAAGSLMTLLHSVDRFDPTDIEKADLTKALRPIKAFLTRHKVDHALIFNTDKASA